jgi:hypothetical protein
MQDTTKSNRVYVCPPKTRPYHQLHTLDAEKSRSKKDKK